jgi:hypothetical protein
MTSMVTRKTTITDFNTEDKDLEIAYKKYRKIYHVSKDLDIIFNIALKDKERFPSINLGNEDVTYQHYIERWVKLYSDAEKNVPSQHVANPKASCSDPAVKKLVKVATGVSEEEANKQECHHNLFMSAENIQGDLLEEFIAINIRQYGWLWCKGNIFRAVDFCSEDGSIYLQIKNKNNTENSSSSAIREGTEIQKWYRLSTSKRGGSCFPTYKWTHLNDIINANNSSKIKCNLSEEAYIKFVSKVAVENKQIVSDK